MSSFEHIYNALQLYKEDPVFLMAVPNVKEMLDVLEKGDDLFEKKYFLALSQEWHAFNILINEFEEHREDVKWYYENKGTYLRERLIYEYVDPKSEHYLSDSIKEDYFSFFTINEYYDQEMDDVLNIYNKCVAGGYGQALYFMYYEDWLYILTNEIRTDEDLCVDEEYPVKYAMTYFTKWIDKRYDSYEKIARESRDIFKELEQSISILSECSKDKFFLKEVPNTFDIIDKMKKAIISNNEDEAYIAFCQLYDIRYTINLHKKYPEDMKFFYENRDISKLIKLKDKDINFSYIEHLYHYITIFETSSILTRCWSRLSGSSTLMEDKFLSINISIGPDESSMEDFIKWVVNKINEATKYYKWRGTI